MEDEQELKGWPEIEELVVGNQAGVLHGSNGGTGARIRIFYGGSEIEGP